MEENKALSDIPEEEHGTQQDMRAPETDEMAQSPDGETVGDAAKTEASGEEEFPAEDCSESAKAIEKENRKMNMAYTYAIAMTILFTLAFTALSFILLLGYKNGYFIFGDGKYLEKVIYVREYDSESGYLTLPEIYDKVSPSVVSIQATVPGGTAIGTGFVMDKAGYIATNYHVIEKAASINIIFINGITVKAQLVGGDALADLAVLKIEKRDDLVPVEFGNSDALVVGEDVCAIGNPANIEYAGSMTQGIVSGVKRNVKVYGDDGLLVKTVSYIQTDTTLNRGNSGGPLIDMYGKVIGVNTLKLAGDYEGVSFALPINGVVEILNEIIAGKTTSGGDIAQAGVKLGISCGAVVEGKPYSLDGITTRTAAVSGIVVSVPAPLGYCSHGILLLDDIIFAIDGVKVFTVEELRSELYKHKTGESAVFSVFRNGESIELTITF